MTKNKKGAISGKAQGWQSSEKAIFDGCPGQKQLVA
jgi:hypothetical protein